MTALYFFWKSLLFIKCVAHLNTHVLSIYTYRSAQQKQAWHYIYTYIDVLTELCNIYCTKYMH